MKVITSLYFCIDWACSSGGINKKHTEKFGKETSMKAVTYNAEIQKAL
jgi:hypothetical protein